MDESDSQSALNLTYMVRPAVQPAAEGAAQPNLLLLHGRGADEEDLMGLEGALDPRLTVISPRAPFRFGPGYAWYGTTSSGKADDASLNASLEALQIFIESLPSTYSLDPGGLYLFGFSQGAVVSSALAMLMPDRIKGVVMHSGYIASHHAEVQLRSDGLAGKPFFLAHGKYDDVVPVTWGRDAQEYLEEAGAEVAYREYPIGHAISEESLYDLSEWLTACLDRDIAD